MDTPSVRFVESRGSSICPSKASEQASRIAIDLRTCGSMSPHAGEPRAGIQTRIGTGVSALGSIKEERRLIICLSAVRAACLPIGTSNVVSCLDEIAWSMVDAGRREVRSNTRQKSSADL